MRAIGWMGLGMGLAASTALVALGMLGAACGESEGVAAGGAAAGGGAGGQGAGNPYDGGPLPPQSTDWPQYAHDAQRTAANPEGPPTPWRFRWIWNPGGEVHLGNRAEPVTGHGAAYVGGLAGDVHALDLETGQELWPARSLGGAVVHSMAFDPETPAVYAGARDGVLYALDIGDGHELGRFEADGPIEIAPLLVERTLYVGTLAGTVVALSLPDLTPLWQAQHAGRAITSPLAFSTSQGRVIVETGKVQQALTPDELVHQPDPSCQDPAQCLQVEALEADSGAPAWTVPVNGVSFEGTVPVVSDSAGLALVRTNLRWDAEILTDQSSGRAPATPLEMVAFLEAHPEAQSFFALSLIDGQSAFTVPVLYGATGEPADQPEGDPRNLYTHSAGIALRRVGDGERIYSWIRSERACPTRPDATENPNRNCGRPSPCDWREDSTLAEVDPATATTRFLELDCHATRKQTDEINALSLGGDALFSPNPNNGVGVLRLLDPGSHGTSVDDPAPTETLPQLAHALCPGGSSSDQCQAGGPHECSYSLPVHADGIDDATCGYGVAGFWVFDDGARHEAWDDGRWSAQTHVVVSGNFVLYRLATSTLAAFSGP